MSGRCGHGVGRCGARQGGTVTRRAAAAACPLHRGSSKSDWHEAERSFRKGIPTGREEKMKEGGCSAQRGKMKGFRGRRSRETAATQKAEPEAATAAAHRAAPALDTKERCSKGTGSERAARRSNPS